MQLRVGSREFRCCREVIHPSGKMVFDGSIERIKCITQHEDYDATSSSIIARQKWKNIPAARWGIQKRVSIYCLDDPLRLRMKNSIDKATANWRKRISLFISRAATNLWKFSTSTALVTHLRLFLLTCCNPFFRFIRAIAYRWTVRWLCGYMGWDSTRLLSACIYHSIRSKYPSNKSTGYAAAQERE